MMPLFWRQINRFTMIPAALATLVLVIWPSMGFLFALPTLLIVPLIMSQRVSMLEAVLPVHGRVILATRVLSHATLLIVPLLVWRIALELRGIESPVGDLTAVLPSGLLLGCVVLLALDVRGVEQSISLRMLALAVMLAGAMTAVFLIGGASITVLSLTLATVAASLYAWRTAPASFRLADDDVPAIDRRASRREKKAAGSAEPAWWVAIAQSLRTGALLFFPLVLMAMAFVGGVVPIYAIGLPTLIVHHSRSRWLDALPISRRAVLMSVLCATAFPGVVAVLIGWSLPDWSGLRYSLDAGAPNLYRIEGVFRDAQTNVALAYWDIATVDSAPDIVAPWGERARAHVVTVLGIRFQNPYTSLATSSPRFVEWQHARLTQSVYGRRLSVAAYDRLHEAHKLPRPRTGSASMRLLAATLLLCYGMVALWLAELVRWHRLSKRPALQAVAAIVAFLPSVGLLGIYLLYVRIGGTVTSALPQWLLLRLVDVLQGNALAILTCAILPTLAMYSLLEWQFRRSESAERIVPLPES